MNYLDEFRVENFNFKNFSNKNFNLRINDINNTNINKLTNLLIKSKIINFEYFLKIILSFKIDSQNFKNIDYKILDAKLREIIEKNKKNILLLVPLCFFYPSYTINDQIDNNENNVVDKLILIYFLHIFEILLKFQWDVFFQNLVLSLNAFQEYFDVMNKCTYNFVSVLRSKCGKLYLKYVFFLRIRIEMYKIFSILAKSAVSEIFMEKFYDLMNFDYLNCYINSRKKFLVLDDNKGIFLAQKNLFSISPLYFATLRKTLDTNYISSKDNMVMKKIDGIQNDDQKNSEDEHSFGEIFSNKEVVKTFKRELNDLFRYNRLKVPFFVFLKYYFDNIKENLSDHAKAEWDEWINFVSKYYDFEKKQLNYVNGKIKKLPSKYLKSTKGDLFYKASALLNLSSPFYYSFERDLQ